VFAEINKGSDVTKGLRHVTKDQMTHKNPELRVSGIIPASASKTSPMSSPVSGKKPARPAKPSSLAGKKPTKLALEGNKWIVVRQFRDDCGQGILYVVVTTY
jgi:adenylyl cyclase-associated protein